MTATLNGTARWSFDGSYNAGNTGSGLISRVAPGPNGANGAVIPDFTISYGSGVVLDSNGFTPCNDWYVDTLSIAGSGTTSIDLSGSVSYKNPFGTTLAFTAIKYAFFGILAPDGAKLARVGPQNVTNAAQLWFGGVGATCYETVYYRSEKLGPPAGWAITAATADLLPINNPGATTISVLVFIAGIK
jgi:hypothetical protein